MDYLTLKLVHQSAVALSLSGFFLRGAASLAGARWIEARWVKTLPHAVDTVLLLSAVALAWMLRLTPSGSPWLVAKIAGLVLYVALGVVALNRKRPARVRAAAFAAAVATGGWIVSVAVSKSAWGFFRALAGVLA